MALKILFPCLVLISLPTSNSLNNRVHLLFIIFLLSRSFQLHLFNSSLLSTCTDHAHVTKLHRTLWMWFSFKQCQLQKWRRLIHWTFSRCCILFSSYCIILHGIWFDVDKFSFFVFLYFLRVLYVVYCLWSSFSLKILQTIRIFGSVSIHYTFKTYIIFVLRESSTISERVCPALALVRLLFCTYIFCTHSLFYFLFYFILFYFIFFHV